MRTYDEDGNETFSSEVIDLKDVDLSAVGELSSAVLRSAISRVCQELSGSAAAFASFQSSMHSVRLASGGQTAVNQGAAVSNDGNREQHERPEASALSTEFRAAASMHTMTAMCGWVRRRYPGRGIGMIIALIAESLTDGEAWPR